METDPFSFPEEKVLRAGERTVVVGVTERTEERHPSARPEVLPTCVGVDDVANEVAVSVKINHHSFVPAVSTHRLGRPLDSLPIGSAGDGKCDVGDALPNVRVHRPLHVVQYRDALPKTGTASQRIGPNEFIQRLPQHVVPLERALKAHLLARRSRYAS